MVEITVSMNGKLTRVLRGEYCVASVIDDDGALTALVGRADAAGIVAAVCTLASRVAYELADGDRKAGKVFLKIMEENLKDMRKSPEMWRSLRNDEEIQGATHD